MNRFLLITIVAATSLCARANYQFTWEGKSNLFHGTFDVTDAEMEQTDMFFYSLSLTNSISITSPDGYLFQWGPGNTYGGDGFGVGGSTLTNSFSIEINYPYPNAQGDYFLLTAGKNLIQDYLITPGPSTPTVIYSETGSWNITYIPEPSAAALLAIGLGGFFIRRKLLDPV